MKTMIRAPFVAPIDAPVIRDGGVVFDDGTIAAVGTAARLSAAHADARVVPYDSHVILPGLVNAHTHLELSDCSCDPPSASFTDWIRSLRGRMRADQCSVEELTPAATLTGIAQCLRFGVTTVGDISQQSHLTRPVIAESPLRAVSYSEVLGLGTQRPRFDQLIERALQPSAANVIAGLSPHAPYTVDLPGFQRCLSLAARHGFPLATHLAESPDEAEFLKHHAGPFRELWEYFATWADPVRTYPGGPIEFAHAIGLLAHPTLLAHVNYCSDSDLSRLAGGGASVVYCPRTHAYFGHPPHRFRDMLAAGVNVAVGTDSCCSSPDLNLLDDLRLVHRIAPEMSAAGLFAMITLNGARALQLHRVVGSLTPGKQADFAIFPVATNDPLRELLESSVTPSHLYIAGEAIRSGSYRN